MSDLFQPGQSPAPGQRYDFHQFPQGQRGGLMMYPTSGVVSGMGISNVSILTPGATSSVLQLTVAAGQVRLDGVLINSPAISNLQLPVPTKNLSLAIDQVVYAYLNPKRLVPASTTAPTSPALNDKYIKVGTTADGSEQLVQEFLQWNGTAWVPFDAIQERIGYGHNNLPLNQIVPTIDTAASNNKNFSSKEELVIWHKTGIPLWLTAPGRAYLRQSASIQVAAVKVNAGTVVEAVGYNLESTLLV